MTHREKIGENGPSCARARKEKAVSPAENAKRVDLIVGRMQAGEWSDSTRLELAAFWKVAPNTVEKLAAEASRRVAFLLDLLGNPEKLKLDVGGLLVRSLELAHAKGSAGDVAKVADVLTKITGARSPEKSEITVTAKELEALPAKALLARIDDQIAKLTTARAKLLDEHPELAPKPLDLTRTPMWAQPEPEKSE